MNDRQECLSSWPRLSTLDSGLPDRPADQDLGEGRRERQAADDRLVAEPADDRLKVLGAPVRTPPVRTCQDFARWAAAQKPGTRHAIMVVRPQRKGKGQVDVLKTLQVRVPGPDAAQSEAPAPIPPIPPLR
jgi:hypothetical protein